MASYTLQELSVLSFEDFVNLILALWFWSHTHEYNI